MQNTVDREENKLEMMERVQVILQEKLLEGLWLVKSAQKKQNNELQKQNY